MPSGIQAILPLLMLLFHAHMQSQGQQNAPQPKNDGKGAMGAPQKAPMPMQRRPEAQGSKGASQGHNGAFTPILGGLGSLMNMNGQHPHQSVHAPQNNPLSFLAGLP